MPLYKRIVIYYFSGTGNSRKIASWIGKDAISRDIECDMIDIATVNESNIKLFDADTLIIFISPIHGFNYPQIVLNFISKFPQGRNKVILMNTRAGLKLKNVVTPGLTGIAFLLSSFILRKKGYKITGQIPFDMPSNWISVHPALNDKAVKFIHEKNYCRTKEYCEKIFEGKSLFIAYRDIVQDILISPIALVYYIAGRFFFAKSFYASVECNNCGLCIKQCPVQAIVLVNSHPFWKFKCESCMKCMNNCPLNAIETPHGLFILIGIICSIVGCYIIDNYLAPYFQSWILKFAVFNIFFFILLSVLYIIQHILLRYKFIGRIISLTSFTHYQFWGRYKSVKGNYKCK